MIRKEEVIKKTELSGFYPSALVSSTEEKEGRC